MLDMFIRDVGTAGGDTVLRADKTVIPTGFSIGEDQSQPATLVRWRMESAAHCHFEISPLLVRPDRIRFTAQRLGAIWPMLEAFYADRLARAEPFAGRTNINLEDHTVQQGLSFCGRDARSFLVPDAIFMRTKGYADTRRRFANGGKDWSSRKPLAFWRGATTGDNRAGWRNLPRIRLCDKSRAHADLLDAAITSIVQLPPQVAREIEAEGYLQPPVPIHAFDTWKYQIDIDGNTNSWPGLFQKLLTGSPVIKIASPRGWMQWYYDRLVAWTNYVPAEADLTDVIDKIVWLRANDEQARSIGEAGRALALSISYTSAIESAIPTIARAMEAGSRDD
jgi:hypothetical protein